MQRQRTIILIGISLAILTAASVWFAAQPVLHTTTSTIERSMSIKDLAKESDLIVVGTLMQSRPWTSPDPNDKDLTFTAWTLEPQQTWKGKAPTPLEVVVLDQGNGTLVEDHDVTLVKGTQAAFYLEYAPAVSAWVPLSVQQGVLIKKNGKFVSLRNAAYTEADLRAPITALASTNST